MPIDDRLKNKPTKNDGSLPRMTYSYVDFPNIATGIYHAQRAAGTKPGDTGWPSILTYDHKSFAAMTRGQKRNQMNRDGIPTSFAGLSRDEYPFASTVENAGSTFVTQASVVEQNKQAAMMNKFYREHGAYTAKRDAPFYFEVVVTDIPTKLVP